MNGNFAYGTQTQRELEKICRILSELLGTKSRWSGIVEMTDDIHIRGAKPFRCDIVINRGLSEQTERWRTLIHEMLHTFSAGYQPLDYVSFRGWEEGVAEQMQRLLRPIVLSKLGMTIEESIFAVVEQRHEYTEYVAALENMRAALQAEPMAFYRGLLAVPIRDRRRSVFEQGMTLPLTERLGFLSVYSAADATLKTGAGQ